MAKSDPEPDTVYDKLETTEFRQLFKDGLEVKDVEKFLTDRKVLDKIDCDMIAADKLNATDILLGRIIKKKAIDNFIEALEEAGGHDTLLFMLTGKSQSKDDAWTDNKMYTEDDYRKLESENNELKRQLETEKEEKNKAQN